MAELIYELRWVGPKPDTLSFSALIKGFCQDRNLEEAKRLYLDLTRNDHVPNRGTFETMILSLCKVGKLKMTLHSSNDRMLPVYYGCSSIAEGVDGPIWMSKLEEPRKLVELG